jgi:hypothetical protein
LWTTIGRRLKQNKRGASTIIAVALSLVIIVVIVSNVVLWSYEMNQLDWEKMNEDITITDVSRITNSSWFVAQSEYTVNEGGNVNGTYEDTQVAEEGLWETFKERQPPVKLDLNGTFIIDLSTWPLTYIQTIEIQLRYRASDSGERWYLKAYNWATEGYSDNGFNSTVGHMPTTEWHYYAVNLTNQWHSYVRDDGTTYVKFHDESPDPPQNRTTIDIDFLGMRAVVDGTRFTFRNEGSVTLHVVSLWIINSTLHQRYDIDLIVNSAETYSYIRADISLTRGFYTVKAVTERGNKAVYSVEI